MVVKGQLVESAVCFSDLYACEERIHSIIRRKPNNIMLRLIVVVVLLFYIHSKYLRSCWDGQLT